MTIFWNDKDGIRVLLEICKVGLLTKHYHGLKVKKIILEKEIDQFEAQRNDESAEEAPRPTKEISCVQLYDVEDSGDRHVYLIAGKKDIFLLGEDSEEWARRLTDEELKKFPIDIYWTGKVTNFQVDSKRTTELRKYASAGAHTALLFLCHF